MSEFVNGIVVGSKLAVFFLVLVYAYLAHDKMEKFNLTWLATVALAFIVMSTAEMIVVLEKFSGDALKPIADFIDSVAIKDALFFVAGVAMLAFLRDIKDDLES